MSNNTAIPFLLQQYQAAYSGAAWHGPNISETLAGIDADTALNSSNGSKNIAELVLHLIAWRQFALRKMAGDITFDITEAEDNFPAIPTPFDTKAWLAIQQQLRESQQELENRILNLEEPLLDQQVSGRAYNFHHLLHGIIQHDLYHLGQMVLLAKYVS